MSDPAKVSNVRLELRQLEDTWSASAHAKIDIEADLRALLAVNERLWVIEDDIRDKERAQAFDAEFIRLARAVYFENDERALSRGASIRRLAQRSSKRSPTATTRVAPPAR